MKPLEALREIYAIMGSQDWSSSDTLDAIAEVLTRAGFPDFIDEACPACRCEMWKSPHNCTDGPRPQPESDLVGYGKPMFGKAGS